MLRRLIPLRQGDSERFASMLKVSQSQQLVACHHLSFPLPFNADSPHGVLPDRTDQEKPEKKVEKTVSA